MVRKKGKKRRAESPVPPKATRVKKEKEKEKPKPRPKARQCAPPKSAPIVVEISDDSGPMLVDEDGEEEKPKPKRARVQGKSAIFSDI